MEWWYGKVHVQSQASKMTDSEWDPSDKSSGTVGQVGLK